MMYSNFQHKDNHTKKMFEKSFVIQKYVYFYILNTHTMNTPTQDFQLKFGKYKGQQFKSTPASYQQWLLSQDWFKMPIQIDAMPKIDKNWDGFGRKGEAQEWAVFEWEKRQAKKQDCQYGICSCCIDSMYYGI